MLDREALGLITRSALTPRISARTAVVGCLMWLAVLALLAAAGWGLWRLFT